MRLFWRKAWRDWDEAESADLETGIYDVRVALLSRWKDQKVIINPYSGYNINRSGQNGWFSIVESELEKCFLLSYKDWRNGRFWSRVLDKVRWMKSSNEKRGFVKSHYIGWFGVVICGHWFRLSTFTMKKVE